MHINQDDIKDCALKYVPSVRNPIDRNSNNTFVDLQIANDGKNIEFENAKDYSQGDEVPDEASSFVSVSASSGMKTIRKSSLIWTLSDTKEKLSSDRLRRVRGSSTKKNSRRQLESVDVSNMDQPVYKADEIKIGDWCVFQNVFERNENGYLLGNILSFRYLDGKNKSDNIYSWDFAPVSEHSGSEKTRLIEILASWYQMKLDDLEPTLKHTKNTFIHARFYIANLSRDLIDKSQNGTICIPKKYSKSMKNLLRSFQ